jgi:hypothetical protein
MRNVGQAGTDWIGPVSNLIAALVGGGLALAGSVLVNRRELVRAKRIWMYDELLPGLRETVGRVTVPTQGDKPMTAWLDDLGRAATIAGRKDVKLVNAIRKVVDDWRAESKQLTDQRDREMKAAPPEDRTAIAGDHQERWDQQSKKVAPQIAVHVDALERYLARKIR